jgi:hypothetical protein
MNGTHRLLPGCVLWWPGAYLCVFVCIWAWCLCVCVCVCVSGLFVERGQDVKKYTDRGFGT